MNKSKEKMKFINKGITLIALVITMVILIILGTITVNFLIGEKGLINRTQQVTEEYNRSDIKDRVTILQSEFLLDKATGEENDFADFLRKKLQVGVTQDAEGNYNFTIGVWQVKATENEVVSIERLDINPDNINPDKIYPNVAIMKADTGLTEGKLVQTEGYWGKEYSGGAYYDIVSSTSLEVDEGKCIQLYNGLYAELHPINNTVTVNQFGAYGNGENDDSGAIQLALNAGYENVNFEKAEYKINHDIDIKNNDLYIFGNDATIFYDDEIVFRDDFIIRIAGTTSEKINNITIDNLKFESRDTGISNKAIRFVKVFNAENIELTNCDFFTPEIENNSTRIVTGIDCRVYYKNITINNCNIKIYTNGSAGGGIWLRGGNEGTENVKIYNNYIEKTSHDELIAIFGKGMVKNISIDNNTLINSNYKKLSIENFSHPVFSVGLDDCLVENVEFSNNQLEIDTGGPTISWYDKVKNFYVSNNNININFAKSNSSFGCTSFGTAGGAEPSIDRNIVFDNNVIQVNELDISASNTHRLINGATRVKNNKIVMNVNIYNIVSNAYEISNNEIYLNKDLGGITSFSGRSNLFYCEMKLNNDFAFQNNKIYFEENVKNTNVSLITFRNAEIKGKKVNITGNNIVENNGYNTSLYLLNLESMLDANTQYIYMQDNTFGHFNKIYKYSFEDIYEIVR